MVLCLTNECHLLSSMSIFSFVPLSEQALNCFFAEVSGKVIFHRVAWGEESEWQAGGLSHLPGHMMQVWMD